MAQQKRKGGRVADPGEMTKALIAVPRLTYRRVGALAKLRGVTTSTVITYALDQYLKTEFREAAAQAAA